MNKLTFWLGALAVKSLALASVTLFFVATAAAQTSAADIIDDRYRINGDGTVTDLTTHLTWQQCVSAEGWDGMDCNSSRRATDNLNAVDALAYAEQVEYAGYDDWRLPTAAELRSLMYCSSGQPSFWLSDSADDAVCLGRFATPTDNRTAFNHAIWKTLWTNTAGASDGTLIYGDFETGQLRSAPSYQRYPMRLVRDTQVQAHTALISISGSGKGKVDVEETGFSCDAQCHIELATNQSVTLVAVAPPGYQFEGWQGDCDSINGNRCQVSGQGHRQVDAVFSLSFGESRFVMHTDGTAYDRAAGLVWYRCNYLTEWAAGCANYNYPPALSYAQTVANLSAVTVASQRGWRLPTQAELGSVIFCVQAGRMEAIGSENCQEDGSLDRKDPLLFGSNSIALRSMAFWVAAEDPNRAMQTVFYSKSWREWDATDSARAIAVKDAPTGQRYVRFAMHGSGSGVLQFADGSQCDTDCHRFLTPGSEVTVTAVADDDTHVYAWSGLCDGSSLQCTFTVPNDITAISPLISVSFNTPTETRQLQLLVDQPVGAANIVVNEGEWVCQADCAVNLSATATPLTLVATAKPGYQFMGWHGACQAAANHPRCEISVAQQQADDKVISVQAHYRLLTGMQRYREITEQSIEDTATGLIWQRCPVGSEWRLDRCLPITSSDKMLAADAAVYAQERVLDGADNWRLPTLSELKSLRMCFADNEPRYPDGQVDCNDEGGYDLAVIGQWVGYGTDYVGTTDDGSDFVRYSLLSQQLQNTDYAGYVRLVRDALPQEQQRYTLSVDIDAVADAGRVAVMPQQFECVQDCRVSVEGSSDAQYVVLTASANPGYRFSGWYGACSGDNPTCMVRMNQAQQVRAVFTPQSGVERFVMEANGVALDQWTGLRWQRCAVGQSWNGSYCEGTPAALSYAQAQDLESGGWRLATQDEWAALSYCASGQPSYWNNANQACAETTASNDDDAPTLPAGLLFGFKNDSQGLPWTANYQAATNSVATLDVYHGMRDSIDNATSVYSNVWLVSGGEKVPLTVQTNGDGGVGVRVDPLGAQCGLVCEYSLAQHTEVTLTAVVPPNTRFSHWSGACSGTATRCTVNMAAAQSVTAHFTWKELAVQVTAAGPGSVSPAQQQVRYGDNLSFSASPDYGYQIGSVSASCGRVARNGNRFSVDHVRNDCAIQVAFDPIYYTVSTAVTDGVSLSPGSAQVIMGQSQAFVVSLDDGYRLTNISGCAGTLSEGIYTSGEIVADCRVTAEAEKKRYQVTFELGHQGTLTGGDLQQTVIHGEAATAPQFTVQRGWEFSGWNVDFSTVTADLTVEAQYVEVPIVYYVDVIARGQGVLSPSGTTEVGEGESLTVTAQPAEGWRLAAFVNGTCPAGRWQENRYTIDAINDDCRLEFSFTQPAESSGALLLIMAVEAQKAEQQRQQ